MRSCWGFPTLTLLHSELECKTGDSPAVKTVKCIHFSVIYGTSTCSFISNILLCNINIKRTFCCLQSCCWAWMNLWAQLDMNRCTCGMLGLWTWVACTHTFSLSQWQFLVKLQLGLSVWSCVYTAWPEAKIRTNKTLKRKSLHCGCFKFYAGPIVIKLKKNRTKSIPNPPEVLKALRLISSSLWPWWVKLHHMVKWPFYGPLLQLDLNITAWMVCDVWLFQCEFFWASPENEKTRGWIFFILYPGIIVYVVWLFCKDYKDGGLVLTLGRELVANSMSNMDLATAKSERSFK